MLADQSFESDEFFPMFPEVLVASSKCLHRLGGTGTDVEKDGTDFNP